MYKDYKSGVVPTLLRELQQKNNCGQGSHCSFSLNYNQIENSIEDSFVIVLGSMNKKKSALAIFDNNPIQTRSLEKTVIPRHVPRPL